MFTLWHWQCRSHGGNIKRLLAKVCLLFATSVVTRKAGRVVVDRAAPIMTMLFRVRTVMLAIRSTRASVNRYQTQLEGDGDLHQLTEAHHLVGWRSEVLLPPLVVQTLFQSSEIRSRQVIVSRIREAIERLKQMCVEKRAALVKTAEEYTDKVCASCFSFIQRERDAELSLYTPITVPGVNFEARSDCRAAPVQSAVRFAHHSILKFR